MNYVVSLLMGVGVGLAYALVRVDAPAPPLVALLGLLGILLGQASGTRITRHLARRAGPGAHSAQPADPRRAMTRQTGHSSVERHV